MHTTTTTTTTGVRKVVRKDGVQGLFKGLTANVVRCIPAAAIQFYSYDLFKSIAVG